MTIRCLSWLVLVAACGMVVSGEEPYSIALERANGGLPFISSHTQPPTSSFNLNLVPAFLHLPDGQPALLTRSVNGSAYQMGNGTASTLLNPDRITLTTFINNASDTPERIAIEPIVDASVVFGPQPGNLAEACGVQDPRVVRHPTDGTYIMTYAAYGSPLPIDPKTNPRGIYCGAAGLGLATTKTPQIPDSWVRHGYNCAGECGKSAAILVRESGVHFMFWGIPTIAVATSHDLLNWKTLNNSWVVPDPKRDEMWVEAGSPPQKLSDGNYIMSYNIANGTLWWGVGFLILDGKDPTIILQRSSHKLWPKLPWEVGNTSATKWEPYKHCIGAMNSLHALPLTTREAAVNLSRFVGYYVAGDAVAGAAVITVSPHAFNVDASLVDGRVWV